MKITIPNSWEALTPKQVLHTFKVMAKVFAGQLSPINAKIHLLIYLTGIRAPKISLIYRLKLVWYYISMAVGYAYIAIKCFVKFYTINTLIALATNYKLGKRPIKPNLDLFLSKLYKLSFGLDFMFTVDGNTIIPGLNFKQNPIPSIKLDRKNYIGKLFNRDVVVNTNITAKEFVECYDLVQAFKQTKNEDIHLKLLANICAILYPKHSNYLNNINSTHPKDMESVSHEIQYGIYLWFSSIIQFYQTHPTYSVLFLSEQRSENNNKIDLGLAESLLSLQKHFKDISESNINDYFNAQVKLLKDSLQTATANGVKLGEIISQTGIPASAITRLI